MPRHPSKVSPTKARKIIKHGTVKGKKITPKQRGLFGSIAGRKK